MKCLQIIACLTLAAALFLAFSPTPLLAAQNILEVKCVDQTGNLVSGAKVEIQNLENNKKKDKKSNREGIALFDKLDDGVYRVFSRQKEFDPALFEFVILKGDSQESVTLDFVPGDRDKKYYFEDQQMIQRAGGILNEGVQSLQASNFADAEAKLRAALELYPSNPDAHMNLAIATIQQKKWDAGEEALKRAVNLSAAFVALRQGGDPAASSYFEQLHKRAQGLLQQLPVLKLNVEGGELLAQKKFPEAIEKYKESLKISSDNPDTYYNLALAQANAKILDEAAENIQKAIELTPGEQAYLDLQKQIAGLTQIQKSDQAEGILKEADAMFNSGNYSGAADKYKEAGELLPPKNRSKAWVFVAKAYTQAKQPDQVVEAYRESMKLDPENPEPRKELANFYVSQKQYEEALDLYTEGADAGSQPADEALFSLGKELAQDGNSEVAKLAFQKAVETNPGHAEAHYELGMLYYFSKEDDARAKELLSKYLEIGQDEGHLNNTRNFLVVIEKRSK